MKYLLKHPRKHAVLNLILIVLAIYANSYEQVFCNPVLWAKIVLILIAVYIVLLPLFISKFKYGVIINFFGGISSIICLYCIIFLAQMNILGFVMPITYFPHFLLFYIIYVFIIIPNSKAFRRWFYTGVGISIFIAIICGILYKKELLKFNNVNRSNYETVDDGYLTERVIGMHFIYHTKFCEFDGWRPPKHDPILVVGMWLNGMADPLDVSLEDRVLLYQKKYPNQPIKFECSCAKMYSEWYHNDELFNTIAHKSLKIFTY